MSIRNGHTSITDDDLLAVIDYLESQIAWLKARVRELHDRQRERQALSAASRGGLARAKACREDQRRAEAKLALQDLAKQNPRLSLTRRCELVGGELGVSGRTVMRWTK